MDNSNIVSGEEFHELMKKFNSMLKPCPICGERAVIIAVFENDESTEVKYFQLLHESDDCENAHWFDEIDNRFTWHDVFNIIEKWNDQSHVNENTSGLYLEFERKMLDIRYPQRNMLAALEKLKKEESDKNLIILKGRQQR